MPKRTDLRKILVIGSGPIVIGQACEFDYSGSQACKALRREGYEVVLVNSNPATIMTDPDMADRTYIEPLNAGVLAEIIAREHPDALLPTLGGQTALNIAVELSRRKILKKYRVELIGARYDAIMKTEDRLLFKELMRRIGVRVPRSVQAGTIKKALSFTQKVSYPLVIRPCFTLGGAGGGIARNREEFLELITGGLAQSPAAKVLVEEAVTGWKEYELEIMRDRADNVVIVCSMENMDPIGIHTGDSITVAPVQTLTDREYQEMRNEALLIIRAVGIETGGANIQFAVEPATGRRVVVEINPRVSRSSALASKATGFPIAKIAAKLAVGYTLDELPNDITAKTPACFEPAVDYCVTKVPRWDLERFSGADPFLSTQMKSVGEVMAIGRTFKESLQKALRSLETGRDGWGADGLDDLVASARRPGLREKIAAGLSAPSPERIFYLRYALLTGFNVEEIYRLTAIDRWFLYNLEDLAALEKRIRSAGELTPELLHEAKQNGFSDRQIAVMRGMKEEEVRKKRLATGIRTTFKQVDTCAGEFEAFTPYFYSTYEKEDESEESIKENRTGKEGASGPAKREKVMILGGGPNRIGQGIEFDYCCVQAASALRAEGREVIMINCNPETVSTDYDISDRLYFEPLTFEHVLAVWEKEHPAGIILQFGGQTPLKLALDLKKSGLPILGTSPESIDLAEDRGKFSAVAAGLGLSQPPHGTAYTRSEAEKVAGRIGYPVLLRPSYVLGGTAMEIVYDRRALAAYLDRAVRVSPGRPVLIDKFLEDAVEVDVDAVADGRSCLIGGIMEHIEAAGIHSGDSACALPPYSLTDKECAEIKRQTRLLARRLQVHGLLNIQFALAGGEIFLLEVNPRASRTVPFVSKATGVSLPALATKVMLRRTLAELGYTADLEPFAAAVKESVIPFIKFPGADIILGPQMCSTGEVMGLDRSFGSAFAKAQAAAGTSLPLSGTVLISIADRDKSRIGPVAKKLQQLGFSLLATEGTANCLAGQGITVQKVNKIGKGRPDIIELINSGRIQFIINSPEGKGPRFDEYRMRRQALLKNIALTTTIQGAEAAAEGIREVREKGFNLQTLQEYCNR